MQENKEQITYVRVEGMFCVHCEETVILALKALPGVLSVGIHQNIAEIRSAAPLDKEEIIKAIRAAGYETDTDKISHKRRQVVLTARWYEMLIIAAAIILLAAGANHFFGYNIFKSIPVVDSEVSYGMLFVTGLLTSIHCVGMCGAIGIFASAEKNSVRSMRRPLLYNIGRVLSYTLTGGIVGAIGSVFSIDMKIRGIIILIAVFFMLLMSLSMLGLAGFHLPTFFAGKFTRVGAGAFLVGLLNGFMPCGPLQAMQLYALSAGGFFKGALSMFLFALGTVPLMMSSGALINLTHGKTRVLIGKIASVLILVLSVSMLNRGFLGLGIDVSVALPKKYDGYTAAVIGDGVQIVSLELDFDSFGDMVVQKGIPVTVFLHADEGKITGCNNEVVCADLGFDVHITPGDNIIEFIPSEEGNFTYTCWMNMIRNHIEVIDDMADSDGNIVIPVEDITAYATFYNYVIDDVIVQLVAIRDGDNIPHISFNTCQSCSPSPKAYYVQKEDVLQCANCGSVFAPEDIGLIHGGCNPWPIEEVQIGGESIVIPVASLDSMRNKFTTWKGPTE